jgi:uncharacterized protein
MKLSYYLIESSLESGGLLLISSRTETYLVLNSELAENFFSFKKNMDIDILDLELKELLLEFKMLIDIKEDEFQIIFDSHWKERKNGSTILNLTFATTLGCNLRCGYCFEQHKQSINLTSKDEESIFQFVSSKLDETKEGMQVTWFGGEPLLGIRSIERLAKRFIQLSTFRGKTYSSDIITNGVLLTHENAKILKKALVSSVQITMDGDKEIHDKMRPAPNKGSYDDVLKGLLVSREYFNTSLRINLSHDNIVSIPILLNTLASLELFELSLNLAPIFSNDKSKENKSYLSREEFAQEQLKLSKMAVNLGFSVTSGFGANDTSLPCTALDPSHYTLEPRGAVHKCVDFLGDYNHTVAVIDEGKLFPQKNQYTWDNYDIFTLYQPTEDDDCLNCQYLPLCYGGCPKNRMLGHDKRKYICTPLRFNLVDMLKLELNEVL